MDLTPTIQHSVPQAQIYGNSLGWPNNEQAHQKLPKPAVDLFKQHHEKKKKARAIISKAMQEDKELNEEIEYERQLMLWEHGYCYPKK